MYCFTNKSTLKPNTELIVKILVPSTSFKYLDLISSNYYQVIDTNGNLLDFGPYRACNGFARKKRLKINCDFYIRIIYYGIPTFEFDNTDFYFGIALIDKNNQELDINNKIKCFISSSYLNDSCKFSFQRSFVERFDLSQHNLFEIFLKDYTSPKIIEEVDDTHLFKEMKPEIVDSGTFTNFLKIYPRGFESLSEIKKITNFDVQIDFLNKVKNKSHLFQQYSFSYNSTGLIRLKIKSTVSNNSLFVVFDEILENDRISFGRGNVNNFIEVRLDSGEYTITTNVPYTLMHILIIMPKGVEITPSLIQIQNDSAEALPHTNNKEIDKIIDASFHSFQQNAFDIFTDCPSRERAGWLCDSFFTGLSEHYYLKNKKIEKRFLENFIYGNCLDIPVGMLPMCFPSSHKDHTFIPNWSLWFVLELECYFSFTKDSSLVNLAKDKVYKLLNYFKHFENEFNLLENLDGWVFLEWSQASDKEYISGINFPTNMLYVSALEKASKLYKDDILFKKSKLIKQNILNLSFNGEFFSDNALRDQNNKIQVYSNHQSETCQYYAIFMRIIKNKQFIDKMINYKNESLVPSAVFIGKFLRLLILYENKQYKQILEEYTSYFFNMAKLTSTIWEKNSNESSCNHGIGSLLGPILFESYLKVYN